MQPQHWTHNIYQLWKQRKYNLPYSHTIVLYTLCLFIQLPRPVSYITVAHEIGHNYGSLVSYVCNQITYTFDNYITTHILCV